MRKAFVDTSAWYGYVRKDDPDHVTTKRLLKVWESRLVTTNFVLDETVTLVRARLGHAPAVQVGDTLRNPSVVELVRVTSEDEENAWRLFMKYHDQDFSFTDCTSFAIMRRLSLETAITTDHHFHQAGFEIAG
jgi:predicted nucleic acid-binding protein